MSTTADTHVVHGCNTVTAVRQNVKQSKKKTQQAELIKRQIQEWGLKKPRSARNKVWDQTFKFDKCPKGTPNGWDHHVLCKVCLGENVGNTVVKLGSSDSPQTLVQHFLQQFRFFRSVTLNRNFEFGFPKIFSSFGLEMSNNEF